MNEITVKLTEDEANIVASLLYFHVAMSGEGHRVAAVGEKLQDAGAVFGSLKWHINSFGHIQITSFEI